MTKFIITEKQDIQSARAGEAVEAKSLSAAKERKVRTALRQKYGTGKYRITAADEVHAYGAMPNSGQYGWYLVGSVDSVLIEIENGWL